MSSILKRITIGGITFTAGATLAVYIFLTDGRIKRWSTVYALKSNLRAKKGDLPTREELVRSLQNDSFDVLIIGGGASGVGCALDAATRGLKTALVEADDFSSGTSSRSTKLVHGGVRYLQTAIMHLDIEQYKMVKEALRERANVLNSAPHLAYPLPIMLPVYTWWQVPYFWIGIKMYDFVALGNTLKSSYLLSKKSALELFPMLRPHKLRGALVYYDGQMDDARVNLAAAMTAIRYGATVVNHVSVTDLVKDKNSNGKEIISGVEVKDEITGKEWCINANCVINATGPFTDSIRKMDDPNVKNICTPSSGVHITLPGYFSPEQMGLLDPSTKDGRVIFFLPWQKHTIAGTTDVPCEVTFQPQPNEDEIMFIINEIKNYLNPDVEVRRGDVLSACSGIRPLVSDPNKPNTQSLARNHIVHISDSKLVTLAGGKWTTYRSMAKDTIDAAIKACDLKPIRKCCQTDGMLLEGAEGWTPLMYIKLVQDFGLESEVAHNLANSYGDKAFDVAKLASPTGKRWPVVGKKIHPEFSYIEAQIRYGIKEYAMTAVDMIARRLRLAFLNVEAAQEALPDVINVMAEELGWSEGEKKKQQDQATEFLEKQMGQSINRASNNKVAINLSKEEIQFYINKFQLIDKGRKGYISINDINKNIKEQGGKTVSFEKIHSILRELDTKMNGKMELDEYLQLMSALKSGHVTYSKLTEKSEVEKKQIKKKISVERSGGGL